MSRSALLAGLCAAFVGCRSSDQQTARTEASVLNRSVDVLRAAPEDAKHAALEALKDVKCTAEDRCTLKEKCVRAYELHARAVDMVARAKDQATLNGDVTAESAAAVLQGAQKDLESSIQLAKQCADLQGEMVRQYSL